MIQGVELVRDRDSKEPAGKEAAKVVYRAFELGLLVFYVGMFSNVLEITPPLLLTEAEADEGVAILDRALADVEAGKVSDEAIALFAGLNCVPKKAYMAAYGSRVDGRGRRGQGL